MSHGISVAGVSRAITDFYISARQMMHTVLSDGAGQRPHYSLRTLARMLEVTRVFAPQYGLAMALFEGMDMAFGTQLSTESLPLIVSSFYKNLAMLNMEQALSQRTLPKQQPDSRKQYVTLGHLYLPSGAYTRGNVPRNSSSSYVMTSSRVRLCTMVGRVVASMKYPVLLQGPTSSGKTALVEYLADLTDHVLIRINNHLHTDLQEYMGSFKTDVNGVLRFVEGPLVRAVRQGYWLLLDELNLAPPDVLEALNRLLDDNRELVIPDTGEKIKPHQEFMLFATQNPAGAYGGRKQLSRAFRNRFLELHASDIPNDELVEMVHTRCSVAPKHAEILVKVMTALQTRRSVSAVFAGRAGYMTPRDLFRWAARQPKDNKALEKMDWKSSMYHEGYALLVERIRKIDERQQVGDEIAKQMGISERFKSIAYDEEEFNGIDIRARASSLCSNIAWTSNFKRLFSLIFKCVSHSEPVLLVSETGTGKTTACQLVADIMGKKLHIVNCHQQTETADLVGGLRPVRRRDALCAALYDLAREFLTLRNVVPCSWTNADECLAQCLECSDQNDAKFKQIKSAHTKATALFEWEDGSLIKAMKNGDYFLIDEISLADDAVLERLNSVLDPQRSILLAEKGADDGINVELVTAHPEFRLLATMNPGGDYGKKELSPALRNRFTEIWCGSTGDMFDDFIEIAHKHLNAQYSVFGDALIVFCRWFNSVVPTSRGMAVTSRDIVTWCLLFSRLVSESHSQLTFIHCTSMVFLDGLQYVLACGLFMI